MPRSRQSSPVVGYNHPDPFDSGYLKVDEIHELWYEQYGKVGGKPVIYLHGGPGGNISKGNTAYFDPNIYHIILFDQRGAGKSTPSAELRENTTWHLIEDIERIRQHVKIEKWHLVFGGSWGSTLALLYTQMYPENVGSLIVRGVFTFRNSEVGWMRGGGGGTFIFPDHREQFVNFLPEEEREDPFEAYYKRLTSDHAETRLEAARAWNKLDLSIGHLLVGKNSHKALEDDAWVLRHARLESHYMRHMGWLEEGQILKEENMQKIRHIPTIIIQGRYDMVCPMKTAWDLHKYLPDSKLHIVPDAGHSAGEKGIRRKLIEACDEFASIS